MSTAHALPTPTVRQDAALIGLVGLAHGISHFSQLVLAPCSPGSRTLLASATPSWASCSRCSSSCPAWCRPCRASWSTATARARCCCRPGPAGAGAARLCGRAQLLDAAGLRRAGRHGQRGVPPGRLHLVQPQGGHHPARPRLQRARHHRQPGLGPGAGPGGAAGHGLLVARGAGRRGWAGAGRAGCAVVLPRGAEPAGAGRQAGRGGGAGRRRLGFLRIPAVWMCFAFFCSMPWR
jgi:hypothetical protein